MTPDQVRRRPGAVRNPGLLGDEIARLYSIERWSLRQIARHVRLTVRMVERYLDGMGVPRRDVEEAKDLARYLARRNDQQCAWPGCSQMPMVGRFRAGVCTFHLKRALGLISE